MAWYNVATGRGYWPLGEDGHMLPGAALSPPDDWGWLRTVDSLVVQLQHSHPCSSSLHRYK